MKNVIVTGAKGQLGSSLRIVAKSTDHFHFSYLDLEQLDLTQSEDVYRYFDRTPADYVINCAAFTAVDLAEKQAEVAFRINAEIPALLGRIAIARNFKLLHISTDYVYNGALSLPHRENETPAPVSVYARSKYAGDQSLAGNFNAAVIRTSWLYSEFGQNFLLTVLRLAKDRRELGMVFDQVGSPTYAGDLAGVLVHIMEYAERQVFIPGIFNYSNEGVCSWYDFAREIIGQARLNCHVIPIRTEEYPLPASRPAFGVMDKSLIKRTFGLEIPYWRDSLTTVIEKLKKNKEI